LLSFFESVGFSQRYEADFQKCANDRSVSHYAQALAWCKVFLQGNSFTSFAGSEVALALLFPMEKVFESYIAAEFRKHLDSGIKIKVQDQRYSLFDSPRRTFLLKPDIVITDGNETVVLDTKWKLLSPTSPTHGISQSDMYQMYAYSKKYDAKKIMLLYPLSDKLSSDSIKPYSAKDNVRVEVVFVDLSNPDTEIQEILRNAFN
jgi:5-methylcytosine-specific restriction enzyme subunit McrC